MLIATWNVNSLNARLTLVTDWIRANEPDVLCFQETKMAEGAFPVEVFSSLGYESVHNGEGRWNGVAIVSKVGLKDPSSGFGNALDEQGARLVSATCGAVRVHSVYVPNGRSLDSEHYPLKLAWLEGLRDYLDAHYEPATPLVICGDFNIAPEDRDVWDIGHFEGMTHVSEPERAALQKVLDWGTVDLFRLQNQEEGVFSWWDYRGGSFHKGHGMRIDLILGTEPVVKATHSVRIDREARKKPASGLTPSDHTVVIATLSL
jgi:exodeoxyribonuclease-3